MSSKSRAARRRKQRCTARGLPDAGRLRELNSQRRLPKDHPSADKYDNPSRADILSDPGEEGIRRRGPIFTSPALVRRLDQFVGTTGVARDIDEVLRDHPGSQPVLSTRMLFTVMLLASRAKGSYKRTVLCEILAGLDAAVAIEWGLLDPDTGHSLVSYKMVWRQVKRLEDFLAKGATTPGGVHMDLQWMVDRFLAASVPKCARRNTTDIALDATDYETRARTIDFTPQSEADAGRAPPGTILKANGKIQHTKDREAGTGYRSATSKHEAGNYNGYSDHLVVAVRSIIRGKPQADVAPYILAMVLVPADEEAGPIGYQVAAKAKELAPRLKVVKADQHYTRKKKTFVRPLRKENWQIVMNQSEDEQKIVRLITAGKHNTPLLIHCGTPLAIWIPPHLLNLPDDRSGAALQQWYDDRKKYQWVVVQHFANGTKKFLCPQCAGNVRTTAKTRNPNRPNRKQSSDQPITAVPDTEYCCDGMITLQVDQLDNYQRNAYGTTDWATDYAGRNTVEGVIAMIKNDGNLDKESCPAFGLAAHTLAALMATVVHNLEQTGRTRRPKNRNNITADRPEQATPDTTPLDAPHPRTATADPTPTPGTPINQPPPIPHRRHPPAGPAPSQSAYRATSPAYS